MVRSMAPFGSVTSIRQPSQSLAVGGSASRISSMAFETSARSSSISATSTSSGSSMELWPSARLKKHRIGRGPFFKTRIGNVLRVRMWPFLSLRR